MSNILVTGSAGQLGSELKELSTSSHDNFFFTSHDTLDISDFKKVKTYCEINSIDIIINSAGYTAVDKAEQEQNLCDDINNKAVKKLAQISKELSIKLIHISTDYLYDGNQNQPHYEDNTPNPINYYAKTKLLGEQALQEINPPSSIIIRTSWLYSSYGENFVKTMLKLGLDKDELGIIYDQVGTPTYAKDLAEVILKIIPSIDNKDVEVYNYSNEGVLSWYDFAKAIMKLSNTKCKINPIKTSQYPTPASRPHYSLLDKTKIKEKFNLEIPYWLDSLKICLRKTI